jgi:branched-chain amino acid transport system substrate-binding protein
MSPLIDIREGLAAPQSRRALLRGLVLAVGASLVAACQQAPAPAPTSAPTAAPKPTTAAAPAATTAPAGGQAPAAGGAPTTIKVGAAVGLTGRYASGGEQIKNGYELAVRDINADGGPMVKALGRKMPLELTILDDASDANQTAQRMETLNNSGIVAYFGGFGSDLHAAAAAVAEKNRVPYIGVAFALFSIHQQGYRYLFSPFPKSPQLTKAIFDLMDSLNPKPSKVAIFAEQTDWGAELRDLWTKEARSRSGYEIVADEQYAPGAKDFAPMILKARSANADAVLALPNPPDGMAIVKQMKELDFTPKLSYMPRAPDSGAWSQSLGKDGDYVLLAPGWSPDLKYPIVEQIKQEHQAKYNKPADATVGGGYAVIQILAAAIERAGKLDRDAVRDALTQTDMMTAEGPIKFNPDGTAQMTVIANQWQDGKQVLIWPPDQAAGKLVYPAKPWKER